MDALLNVVEVIAWIVGVPAVLLLLAWGLSSRPFRGRSHGSTVLGDALGVSIEVLQPTRAYVVEELTRKRFDIVQRGDEDKPFDGKGPRSA